MDKKEFTMQSIHRLIAFVLISTSVFGTAACTQQTDSAAPSASTQPASAPAFDSLRAAQLGADAYGMRRYVIAFLKAGPNRDQDSTRAMELQRAHMENIRRLAEEGKLILAGPFLDADSLRGLYVFNVSDVEEARALTATDPAIQAGRLEMELRPWYGSAALQEVNRIHERIAKEDP